MIKHAHSRLLSNLSWTHPAFVRAAAGCMIFGLLVSGCLPTTLLAFTPRPTVTSTPIHIHESTATPAAPTSTRDPMLVTPPIPTATTTAMERLTKNSLRGLQVTFWHPWGGTDEMYIKALISEFNARNEWSIQVIETSQGSRSELARSVNAAAALPDIVAAYPEQALAWQAESPVIIDLNTYIYDPTWGMTAGDLLDFPEKFLPQDQSGDQRLGLPAQRSLLFFIYNTTWAAELGFNTPPTTPDEFRLQACAAAKANRNASDTTRVGTGGWLVNSAAATTLGWVQAFGGSFAPDISGLYHFNTPQAQNAFQYLDALYSDGCAWNGRSPTHYDYFAGRYALFITASMEDLPGLAAAMQRLRNGDEWSVLAFPSVSGKPVSVVYGPSYYVFKSTPARQLASWLLIRWLTAPEQDSRLARGWSTYPVRAASLGMLADFKRTNPQLESALPLLTFAVPVPAKASWLVASAIIQDASVQLYTPETRPETIQPILGQMDSLAAEVIKQP